jgi:hypothetical protein
MKENQQTFLLLLVTCILCITNGYSQESIVVTGGNAAGAGGTASYSIGQIAYTVLPGSDQNAIQGVQQPYEITTLGNNEFAEIKLTMTAYPNPVIDELSLVVNDDILDDLSYGVFDINGKTVSQNLKVTTSETRVSMQGLNQGVYFLVINKNSKNIKTFKIIKK